jgi:F0F1-type ATP synthase delta subunit
MLEKMNDKQILTYALASAPTMLTVLIGILLNNARLSDMNNRMAELRSHMDARFDQVDVRLDETKDLWRSELHRVEEVLDARLKHIER